MQLGSLTRDGLIYLLMTEVGRLESHYDGNWHCDRAYILQLASDVLRALEERDPGVAPRFSNREGIDKVTRP